MNFDLSKPNPTRSFMICVKSQKNYNIKNFSLYKDYFDLDELHDICYMMLNDERENYLDLEKRYIFDEGKKKKKFYTHTIQITQYQNNKAIKSYSFGLKESAYSSNEIACTLEAWFKEDLRKKNNLEFKDDKVKLLIEVILNGKKR